MPLPSPSVTDKILRQKYYTAYCIVYKVYSNIKATKPGLWQQNCEITISGSLSFKIKTVQYKLCFLLLILYIVLSAFFEINYNLNGSRKKYKPLTI